ncbi:MAG: AAA family ATPase [Candidatus Polarisedimenticolaceae bacterium]|nr:AAA family ATPase [Candidatus Polarisedimenticolaceae bacterium]
MYLEHYGLREAPFSITPDTDYFFAAPSHQEALNVLLVALRMGEGFIKVVGEVGTGKTLLCRKLLKILDGEFVTAYIPDPFLTPVQLRLALAHELGIDISPRVGRQKVYDAIRQRLIEISASGQSVVLILDEAQALPDESLEGLRLLTNFETEKRKLLQIAMFGQPELDQRLNQPSMRQLKQRITFSYLLHGMDCKALSAYVIHRLKQAGYQGEQPFSPRALRCLYKGSRGIPRLVNILSHKSLLATFGTGKLAVTSAAVKLAIKDTEGAEPLPTGLAKTTFISILLLLFAGLYFSGGFSL